MRFLQSYRKPGGFHQLLSLYECTEPERQESLLRQIAIEDPGWAHLLKLKSLSIEKILQSPSRTLRLIWPECALDLICLIWLRANTEERARIESSLPATSMASLKRRSDELTLSTETEYHWARQQLFSTVRELFHKRQLSPKDIDPALEFDTAHAEKQEAFKTAA